MRVIIVTQTFPPRFGGMQSVMSALAKNFSKTISTFVLPDHNIPESHPIRSYKIKFNFSKFPKFLRPLIKKIKLKKILKKDDIIICDSWKSLNAIPNTNNKVVMLAHGQEYLSKSKKKKINKLLKNCLLCYPIGIFNDLDIKIDNDLFKVFKRYSNYYYAYSLFDFN